jgi:hypothetical protein
MEEFARAVNPDDVNAAIDDIYAWVDEGLFQIQTTAPSRGKTAPSRGKHPSITFATPFQVCLCASA